MRSSRLILSSLVHYWRTNVAVVLGVTAATAVIAGALIVGDSVRGSLARMSLDRLGGVDHALHGGRFFRQDLVDDLGRHTVFPAAPAIVLPGSLTFEFESESTGEAVITRAGGVQVYGVNEQFWQLTTSAGGPPEGSQVVLNRRLADQLGADVGGDVALVVEIPPSIPRDSLLGERNETVIQLLLTVSGIAEADETQGRFGLNPSQQLPLNAFLSLDTLQQRLGLSRIRPSPRDPAERQSRVNAVFIGTDGAIGPDVADSLTQEVARLKTLSDLSLRIVTNQERGYLSLESERMILEDNVADAALRAADELEYETSPVLVYLLNEVWNADDADAYSMYPVVAGVEFRETPPFGPFHFTSGGPPATDSAGAPVPVVLNDWLATDLRADVGQELTSRYYQVGDRGDLPEDRLQFEVAGVVELAGAADDRGFTPEVPGITDVETFDDWRQPFPLERGRVTTRDDDYWTGSSDNKAYRATPKMFVTLAAAQSLWRSRYGQLTSFRFAPRPGQSLADAADEFERTLLQRLGPESTGLVFQPVKFQGLEAARGTNDFSGLFIGFSFFLILAAAILIGLLFRLGIERRVRELGLLSAVGLPPRTIRRLFLVEGAVLVLCGGAIGCCVAVGYAALMIHGLRTWWKDAVGTQFLSLSVEPVSLLTGFVGAGLVSLLAVGWALRQSRGFSNRELLAGVIDRESAAIPGRGRWSRRVAVGAAMLAAVCLIASLAGLAGDREAFSGFSWRIITFFVSGIAALTAGLAAGAAWLASDHGVAVAGQGAAGLARLAARNAARNRRRSIMTGSLIACATFVIVAIATARRNPAIEAPRNDSGNGGFTLVAETSLPVLYDLNTTEGRDKAGIDAASPADERLLASMRAVPFRVKPGEDASCLNLYQTRLPTILGVPDDVIELFDSEQRFRFANTPSADPWQLLHREMPEGRIPVLGDMNTLQYSLHKGIGQTLDVPNSSATLEIAGMLDASIFQGVLLMSENHFHEVFPEQAGFQYFLIEVGPAEADRLQRLLETELADSGFDAERVSERLADFLAVQNTYLSTFQALGGLGLLLGTFGLGTVMLRNVLERRGELALLRAVGFRNGTLGWLVFIENALLMLCGLFVGTAAALLAMAPHLATTGADVQWSGLLFTLAGVAVIGMLASVAATRAAVRTPILATLRAE